ncbi:preprotein translocase subunit SecE [Blochmannia endosymbiont of Camponotus (Colobopsis) obliquus]|uniref:preprotein translocase subunit SecE n=1 Tax=Blochmannia endosymbiont of Camponotus (Colobopsis) obliquus TaxID=1505597 RepID=UPI00061A60CD|nr:preprotein translocase subunit SecE [Blochmannia endosymbiont of Camponotus (Colobopsis) obliquus]AKC60708.1 Preprotein translocase subunit SecE [Blochmannia endosymbiont of Camponotus (Colobopsis) obliquus]
MGREKNIKKIFNLKIIKWIGTLLLLGIVGVCNYFYNYYSCLIRILDVLLVAMLAIFVLLKTEKGKMLLLFIRSSKVELFQVIWPTKRETCQATLVVAVVTVLMSLILWGLDSILVQIISLALRL